MSKSTQPDKSEHIRAAQFKAAAKRIDGLRMRLLDLTNANRMLSFKHSERSRTHVRVIDEMPDALLTKLIEGDALAFRSLPEPDNSPADENTTKFLRVLEEARLTDEPHIKAIKEIGDDPRSKKSQEIERALKDRVRQKLGMPVRPSPDCMSIAEYAKLHGLEPNYDLPLPASDGPHEKRHLDNEVQTLLLPQDMDRKLSGLSDRTKTILQETGVNTLYCAFGFLEWHGSDDSEKIHLAPLLLHPVEMERRLVRSTYKYSITSTGEETQTNITLAARLTKDFGIKLPELGEDDTPEVYFKKIQKAVKSHKRWQVRRFVTAGHFAFARLVMYNDLDPDNWPGDTALSQHPILSELLGGSDRKDAYYSEEYDVDDPTIAKKVPLLITDADASQFSAIVDVMSGKNLVIKGPPGTGKSQTITNIIAAAIAEGKNVLFVAEKMAALDVVKKRLDDAGIGDFCLELHSTRARKRDVLDSLGKRLDLQERLRSPRALDSSLRELEDLKDQLTAYVKLINQPFGSLGISIHDLLWGEQRTRKHRGSLKSIDAIELKGAESLTSVDVNHDKELLRSLEEHWRNLTKKFQSIEQHPWHGITRGDLNPYQQEDLQELVAEWLTFWRQLHEVLQEVAQATSGFGIEEIGKIELFTDRIGRLPAPPLASGFDFTGLREPETLNALRAFTDDLDLYHKLLDELAQDFVSAPPVDQVGEIVSLSQDLEPLGVQSNKIADLSDIYLKLSEEAQQWNKLSQVCQKLLTFFGITDPATARTCRQALEASSFLKGIKRKTLLSRTVALTDEANGVLIEAAAKKCLDLQNRLTDLETRFRIPREHDEKQLREWAATLRNAGPLSFFIKKVRVARASYGTILRDSQKQSKHQAAADLERIAQLLEDIREFSADDRIKSVCSDKFHGLKTEFDELVEVVHYAWQVRRTFPSVGTVEQMIRQCLLEGKLETLDAVCALGGELNVEQVKARISPVEFREDCSAQQYAAALKTKAEKIQRLHRELTALGVKESAHLASLPTVADRLRALQRVQNNLEVNKSAASVLRELYKGVSTNVDAVREVLTVAEAVISAECPRSVSDYLLNKKYAEQLVFLKNLLGKAKDILVRQRETQSRVCELAAVDLAAYFGAEPASLKVADAIKRLTYSMEQPESLASWVRYVQARHQADARGLGVLLGALQAEGTSFQKTEEVYQTVLFRTLCKRVFAAHPVLATFSGLSQEQARRRFRELDKEVIRLYQKNLAATLASRDLEQGVGYGQKRDYTERALIEHERSKQKRHIPIRALVARATTCIQQMKPCFMMSPLSVAQFLQPTQIEFDLLIIDEASQMRPEDSLCAIARAKQFVVVGDPMQLPPTSFFDSIDVPVEEDEEEEEVVDNEAILDLAMSTFRPWRELRWHYRSRHGSLIAFSNKRFYDRSLIVFPSAQHKHEDLGVISIFCDGVYRGRSTGKPIADSKRSINPKEAEQIVQAAEDFMHRYPNRSLGIVTLNQGQRDLIKAQLDHLIAMDNRVRHYFQKWETTLEPFFVKNLELVQGDERDVIFISTVYGPDESGRVMQRFGPINSDVGHRRLNVLFTRAKEQVRLFTSMHPTDVRIDEHSSEGVRALRAYLEYASTGRLEIGEITGRGPETDFELTVMEHLVDSGYEVIPQVGVAGYFIDLAVRHPNNADGFLLGIECDGATYHQVKSARDRDRLRQEVLENLGWSIYRIWSTDWFNDPQRETKKLLAHINQLAEQPWRGWKPEKPVPSK